jgi:hypothetical protein
VGGTLEARYTEACQLIASVEEPVESVAREPFKQKLATAAKSVGKKPVPVPKSGTDRGSGNRKGAKQAPDPGPTGRRPVPCSAQLGRTDFGTFSTIFLEPDFSNLCSMRHL